jgi:hypothetical protein
MNSFLWYLRPKWWRFVGFSLAHIFLLNSAC